MERDTFGRLLVVGFSSSALILVHFSIHLWTHCVHIFIFYIYRHTNPYFSCLSAVLVLVPVQVFTSCPGPGCGLLSLFLVLVLVPEIVWCDWSWSWSDPQLSWSELLVLVPTWQVYGTAHLCCGSCFLGAICNMRANPFKSRPLRILTSMNTSFGRPMLYKTVITIYTPNFRIVKGGNNFTEKTGISQT